MIGTILLLFPILWALCRTDNAQALQSENIIGGSKADDNEFTYHALVLGHTKFCGGAIIGPSLVITAASCVFNKNGLFRKRRLIVTAGVRDLNFHPLNRVQVKVDKIYVPAGYKMNTYPPVGDIAVLRLSSNLDLVNNPHMSMIDLPPSIPKYRDFTGRRAYVTGFGVDAMPFKPFRNPYFELIMDGRHSLKLGYIGTTILSEEQCKAVDVTLHIGKHHMCAQADQVPPYPNFDGTGVCRGDEGGPLVVQNKYLVGVLSAGPLDCDESSSPGIYTSIVGYKNFIDMARADDCSIEHVLCKDYRRSVNIYR